MAFPGEQYFDAAKRFAKRYYDCAELNLITCRGRDYTQSDNCAGDVPHLFYQLLTTYWPEQKLPCADPEGDCDTTEYFGPWKDVYKSIDPGQSWPIRIDHALFCAKPYWFNKGPHRQLIDVWYENERYIITIEEGFPCDRPTHNVAIAAFSQEGKNRIDASKEYVVDIIGAALYFAPQQLGIGAESLACLKPTHGYSLDFWGHWFQIKIAESAPDLAAEECKDSPDINKF